MRRGFTLIETLIYVAILAMATLALLAMFRAGAESDVIVQAQTSLLDAERAAQELIQDRITEATGLTAPASGSGNVLTLTSPVAGESPVTFTLTNGQITMQLGAGAAAAITPPNVRVTSFTVTRLAGTPPGVRVSFETETDAGTLLIPGSVTFTSLLRYD